MTSSRIKPSRHGYRQAAASRTPPSMLHYASMDPLPRFGFGLLCITLWFVFVYISISLEDQITFFGIPILKTLQQYRSPMLNKLSKFVEITGFEIWPLLITSFLWSGAKMAQKFALRLFLLFSYALYIQSLLKAYFREPRPYQIDDTLIPIGRHTMKEYSFPSGHSYAVCIIFFTLATTVEEYWRKQKGSLSNFHVKRFLFYSFALFYSVATVFTRIYAAVHFPHDIVAGYIAGFTIVLCYENFSIGLVGHTFMVIAMLLFNVLVDKLGFIGEDFKQDGLFVVPAYLAGMIIVDLASNGFEPLWRLKFSWKWMVVRSFVGISSTIAMFVVLFRLVDRFWEMILFCLLIPLLFFHLVPLALCKLQGGSPEGTAPQNVSLGGDVEEVNGDNYPPNKQIHSASVRSRERSVKEQ